MNGTLPNRPLKVTLNGLDERAQVRLSMFLNGPAQGVCEVVSEEKAEAVIFDLDGYGGERQWHAFREHFHGPAVVMSVSEKHLHNAVWVRKPLNAEEFLAAIELVHQRLKTEQRLRDIERAAELALRPDEPKALPEVPPEAFPEVFPEVLPEAIPGVLPEILVVNQSDTQPEAQPEVQPEVPAMPPVASAPIAPVPAESRRPLPPPLSGGVTVKSVGDANGAGRAAGLAWNEQRVHESCGTMDDATYLDPNRRGELFYDPTEYLQDVLHRACQRAGATSRPIKVAIGEYMMIVLPGGQQVYCPMREQRLRPLSVTPTPTRLAALQELSPNELPDIAPRDPHLHSSETMLWTIALWASRGRVPFGVDLNAPVSLLRWPNYSRLLIPPHAVQIAALWTTRPLSLMQTAKQLAVPHRYVFALYSACLALDLVENPQVVQAAVAPPLEEKKTAPTEKRGVIGSLLRKLRLFR